jgi:hypothetical protein
MVGKFAPDIEAEIVGWIGWFWLKNGRQQL